nr:hypothetical protein [Haloglomus sp. DT116]
MRPHPPHDGLDGPLDGVVGGHVTLDVAEPVAEGPTERLDAVACDVERGDAEAVVEQRGRQVVADALVGTRDDDDATLGTISHDAPMPSEILRVETAPGIGRLHR